MKVWYIYLLKNTIIIHVLTSMLLGYFTTSSDIDECVEETDNCEQICTNTAGRFSCSCHTGYRLMTNQHGCEGVMFSPILMMLFHGLNNILCYYVIC